MTPDPVVTLAYACPRCDVPTSAIDLGDPYCKGCGIHFDPPLRVLSLFAGIGGIDLGLERAGMKVVAHSEIEPYACKVLAKHWPDVPNLGDITTLDTTGLVVDVIAGGFPCQDISLAGKGAGIKEGTRSGLWSEYARIVRELRPRYVIVENVSALAARGLDIVLGDLAALGYGAWWDCVPAASVGAPHRRDRLFIVATRADVGAFDTDTSPMQWAAQQRSEPHGDPASTDPNTQGEGRERQGIWGRSADVCGGSAGAGPDPERAGLESRGRSGDVVGAAGQGEGKGDQRQRDGDAALDLRAAGADADGGRFEVGEERLSSAGRREVGSREHGHDADRLRGSRQHPEGHWSVEPGVGRVANGIPHRVDRLRCLGNAVVPQVAQYIGELVVAHHESQVVVEHVA